MYHFQILAVDYSANYIDACEKLQNGEEVTFLTKTGRYKTKLSNISLDANEDNGNIRFKQVGEILYIVIKVKLDSKE